MEQLKTYIAKAEFDCRRNRYDAQQVDAFLADVMDKLKGIEQKMAALEEKNAAYESQSASMAAAMITAEKNSAAIIAQAEAQAAQILAAAREEGDQYVKSMYDRQADLENEYAGKKAALAKELQALKDFKDTFHLAVERDVVAVLSRISGMDSNKVWNSMPEELRKEYGLEDTYAGLDLNEILKDLPETDSELKAMIEGLL